eukprot:1058424-Pleurochrysis_carterae.AAC.2
MGVRSPLRRRESCLRGVRRKPSAAPLRSSIGRAQSRCASSMRRPAARGQTANKAGPTSSAVLSVHASLVRAMRHVSGLERTVRAATWGPRRRHAPPCAPRARCAHLSNRLPVHRLPFTDPSHTGLVHPPLHTSRPRRSPLVPL